MSSFVVPRQGATMKKTATNGGTILLDINNASVVTPKPMSSQQIMQLSLSSSTPVITEATLTALSPSSTTSSSNTMPYDEAGSNKRWHLHHVTASDSLLSLSIRYGVSVQDIKRWNKLPLSSDRKIPSLSLRILVSPDSTELLLPDPYEQNISKLQTTARLSYYEAKFYIDGSKNIYEEALKDAMADIEWEKKQRNERNQNIEKDHLEEDGYEHVPLINKKKQ